MTRLEATDKFQAGIYDLSEEDYFRDPCPEPSLSASGAKAILDCPARYKYSPPRHSDAFDFGKAAHAHVLGVGAPTDIIDAPDWRTKDARDRRDASREAGRTPLLAKDWERVEAMRAQLRAHPVTAALLDPESGKAEQSAFWFDRCWRRARFDWLPDVDPNRRLIVTDYKTVPGRVDPGALSRTIARFSYHVQAPWYLAGVRALLDVAEPAFVFVFQEKDPPHFVAVVELEPYALEIGAALGERAVDRFIECNESGVWPGYGDEVVQVGLPRWAEIEHETTDF